MITIDLSRKNKEEEIILGLKKGNQKTLVNIYKDYFPHIKTLITSNSGTEDDAKDIFQDAMIAVYQNVCNDDFELTCQFRTYLHAICANLWHKKLRNEKMKATVMFMEELSMIAEEEIDDAVLNISRLNLVSQKLKEISQKCRDLLTMHFNGCGMSEIANTFKFASIGYAKKRKFQCKENLLKRIKLDPQYKLLTSYD